MYKIYEDDTTDVESGSAGNTEDDEDPAMTTGLDRKIPTPEANGNYLNVSVMFPRGNIYEKGKFIRLKTDAHGHAVGR